MCLFITAGPLWLKMGMVVVKTTGSLFYSEIGSLRFWKHSYESYNNRVSQTGPFGRMPREICPIFGSFAQTALFGRIGAAKTQRLGIFAELLFEGSRKHSGWEISVGKFPAAPESSGSQKGKIMSATANSEIPNDEVLRDFRIVHSRDGWRQRTAGQAAADAPRWAPDVPETVA